MTWPGGAAGTGEYETEFSFVSSFFFFILISW